MSKDGTTPGVPLAEYKSFRDKLVQELREVRSPEDGELIATGVFTREEIFPGPAGPLGPDITMEMRDGGLVSILPGTEMVSRRPVVSGAHRPLGIFGAARAGYQKGFDAGEISILDVAPLILHTLGFPIYSDLEGRVPAEIFEETMMEQKPIQKVDADRCRRRRRKARRDRKRGNERGRRTGGYGTPARTRIHRISEAATNTQSHA